ncbi:flagellar filament capping protein FliD [Erwinia sp.]|uniref:flagellar filament capping protein FliD n=1 Tax=Erwinia citreus TaxID=558 RepID=UPI0028997F0D|nr:flagellar filament capping protein FliD [Erwinia sp.]
MASVSSLGVGTSLDLDSLYTSLETAEKTKLTTITKQQSTYNSQLSSYSKLQSSMAALETAAAALTKPAAFSATAVTSTNTAFTATTSATASTGDYSVNVTQIAKAQTLMSGSFSSNSTALGGTTSGNSRTLTIAQGGSSTPLTLTLTDSQTSLSGIADAINKSAGNVSASIIKASSGDYRLMLSSKTTGTDSDMTISVTGDDTLQSAIGYSASASGTQNMSVQTASQNAKLSVNGVAIERSSNNISDALTGVTLNLNAPSKDASTETLTVSRSIDDSKKTINAFVTAYNSLKSTIASVTKYTAVTAGQSQSSSNGALIGDSTVRAVENSMNSILTTVQGGSYSILAQLGVTIDPSTQSDGSTGALTVDDTKLTTALTNNPQAVSQFFIGDGTSTGFATKLDSTLTSMLSTTVGKEGIIQNAKDGINDTLKTLSDRYDQMSDSIDATMARYKTQFTNLSSLVNSLTNTSTYLTSQFSSTSSS